MTKEPHKAIMKRSRLRNKFLKTKSITDRKIYNVIRSTKKSYLNDLDMSEMNDRRPFWKMIGALFLKKNSKNENINLNEEGKNISNNDKLCHIFNNHFLEVISSLKILSLINNSAVDSNAVRNPLTIATKLFDQHPSIINIKKTLDSVLNFRKPAVVKYKK